MKKIILDVCCGGRMMWFNKKHPACLYVDKRSRARGFMKTRENFEISPDLVADFKKLPLKDKSFNLVVFDPPHTIRAGNGDDQGIIAQRYGRLMLSTWETELAEGFKECWRVLKPAGVLIFKWNECDKKINDLKHFFPAEPLFGSRPGSRTKTLWLCFMKF